jgi:GT2 family glycosyltransferase
MDAFLSDPPGYARALIWRARGLRVRSRSRLAALKGRSSRVYDLWIARVEPKVRAELRDNGPAQLPFIVPVINSVGSADQLARTLQSIDPMLRDRAVLVGGPEISEMKRVESASGLAKHVGGAGSWLCIVRSGDLLAEEALRIYSHAAARSPESRIIYADDDLIEGERRKIPHFKPSWNPELFEHHDFVTESAIIRVTPDMLLDLPLTGWPENLVKRALRLGPEPRRLPAVLHHRLDRPKPELPARPREQCTTQAPLVSVIVPTRNRLSYLRTCIDGVRCTSHPAIELIVIDNDSDEPETLEYLRRLSDEGVAVRKMSGPFNFSALNNAAVEQAHGTLLCFLNNDVEMIEPDWLTRLVERAVQPDLGAVGARLLYPDGSIQHAGVVTGVGGGAAHAHRLLRTTESGYFLRHRLPQRTSAVTGACLVVSKDKFLAVGGFNEVDFAVAFNDIDLCLKLNSRGWQSFYEPRAVLIHHESKSRGDDRAKANRDRFACELAALKRHWSTDRLRDPYHHPQLSPFCEQFLIAV